jgi:hypothetical protein
MMPQECLGVIEDSCSISHPEDLLDLGTWTSVARIHLIKYMAGDPVELSIAQLLSYTDHREYLGIKKASSGQCASHPRSTTT